MKNNNKLNRRTFIENSVMIGSGTLVGSSLYQFPFKNKNLDKDFLISSKSTKICQIKKEVRIFCPELILAPTVAMQYIGEGLKREEKLRFSQSSDWHLIELERSSDNNGKTWTPWRQIPFQISRSGEFTKSGGASQSGSGPFDYESHMLIKPVFQRIFKGDPDVALSKLWSGERLFWDHGFYQLSDDNGKTWGNPIQLKYEVGPDFQESNWGRAEWLTRNEMYIGNAIVTKNNTVVICATVPVPFRDTEDEKFPSIFPNNYREGHVAGAMCFIGKWDKRNKKYVWLNSNSVFLPRRISSRGLVEIDLSELKNGNLLMIMRGSDTPESPGRKWFSVSKDGGLTWSPVSDIRYNTGEQLYSPASIHQTFRSSKTGKLYWVGNISKTPPKGNHPRYPLCIIEVDEDTPSFMKDTFTIIDTRDPEKDTEIVQMSNFSLLENRETFDVEIYLTRIGENEKTWSASAYRYTLIFNS